MHQSCCQRRGKHPALLRISCRKLLSITQKGHTTECERLLLQALTGAQLYQMHQSPLPEEGETFRPAKDILQELFFNRAPQSRALPPESSLQPEQTQEQQADQRVENSPTDEPKDATDTAAERVDAINLEGTLPEQAQSWEPMWGSSSSKVPPASDLDPSAKLMGDPPGAAHTKRASQGKGTWEAAWGKFQASEVPDQAAGSALREPEQDAAAWGAEWGSGDFTVTTSAPAQADFTLLLPSREPPPPPAPLVGVDCTAQRGAASAAQREAVAARPERPLPVMRPEDRHKCERAFKQVCASAVDVILLHLIRSTIILLPIVRAEWYTACTRRRFGQCPITYHECSAGHASALEVPQDESMRLHVQQRRHARPCLLILVDVAMDCPAAHGC